MGERVKSHTSYGNFDFIPSTVSNGLEHADWKRKMDKGGDSTGTRSLFMLHRDILHQKRCDCGQQLTGNANGRRLKEKGQ